MHGKLNLQLVTSNQLLCWRQSSGRSSRHCSATHNPCPKNLVVTSFRVGGVIYMGSIYFTRGIVTITWIPLQCSSPGQGAKCWVQWVASVTLHIKDWFGTLSKYYVANTIIHASLKMMFSLNSKTPVLRMKKLLSSFTTTASTLKMMFLLLFLIFTVPTRVNKLSVYRKKNYVLTICWLIHDLEDLIRPDKV